MNKPFKVLSATSLATVMAASALIPVASVSANEIQELDVAEFAIVKDGKILKVSADEYNETLLIQGFAEEATAFGLTNDKYYEANDYNEALLILGTEEEALADLDNSDLELDLPTVDAYLDEEGYFQAKDEQPEDRLNETFFYNVA